jgi:hypothetical protein
MGRGLEDVRCERPAPPRHSYWFSPHQERRSRAKEQQQPRPSNAVSWGLSASGDSASSSAQECNHLRQHIETLTRSKALLHKSMLEQMSSLRKQLVQSEAEVRNPPVSRRGKKSRGPRAESKKCRGVKPKP